MSNEQTSQSTAQDEPATSSETLIPPTSLITVQDRDPKPQSTGPGVVMVAINADINREFRPDMQRYVMTQMAETGATLLEEPGPFARLLLFEHQDPDNFHDVEVHNWGIISRIDPSTGQAYIPVEKASGTSINDTQGQTEDRASIRPTQG